MTMIPCLRLSQLVGVLATSIVLIGCPASTPTTPTPTPVVTSVTVSPATATISAGQSTQLTATVTASGGATTAVTWSSNNPAIATVDATGRVQGISAGTATIVATSTFNTAKQGTAGVTISPPPVTIIILSQTSGSIAVGATLQLTATPKDGSGNSLSDRTVTWASNNAAIANVSASGLVTGVSAGGPVTITATCEGTNATAVVTVTPVPVANIALSSPQTVLTVPGATQVTAVLSASNGSVLTGRTVSWASSNVTIATVDQGGLVTAVAPGAVTITATSEGRSGTINVTVVPPAVASVSVLPGAASLTPGQVVTLAAIVRDAGQNQMQGSSVTWASSNVAIATVLQNGQVTAVASGTATITATSISDVTKQGTASVTVTSIAVASVSLSLGSVILNVGDSWALGATARDAAGNVLNGRTFSWTSSNLSAVDGYLLNISGINDVAVVSGLSAGTATVTATAEGRSASAVVTVLAPVVNVCTAIAGASIQAQDGQYLGRFTNQSDPYSVKNSVGLYGATWSSTSTNTTWGLYGSSWGLFSARNPSSITPPKIFKNGALWGYYTTGSILLPRVSPTYVMAYCTFP